MFAKETRIDTEGTANENKKKVYFEVALRDS